MDGTELDVEDYTCTANAKGKCKVKVPGYFPQEYGAVTVEVLNVESNLGAYNSEENVIKIDNCPVFSSACKTFSLGASA